MKIALIYNFAQHYRSNIFTLMDKEMNVDFYFGDHYLDVKKMDYSLLHHPVKEVKNIKIGPFYWQNGIPLLAFRSYDTFIVLGEPLCLSTWLLGLLCKLMGKKLFFWTHGWYGREHFVKRIIKKIFFCLGNGIMTYGEYARKLMIQEGFRPDCIQVIHNSLDYDYQLELRGQIKSEDIYTTHFSNSLPNIIFVGRLTQVKQLDLLVEALSVNKSFNITFIGGGEEENNLKDMVHTYNLESQVWFYGPCYDEETLSRLIYNADLCVAPGNIGLTAMHAMVYGCPCISHNDFKNQMPEFEAIKTGVTGAFFQRGVAASLAQSIQEWIEHHNADRENVRKACFKEIDENWNPHVQLKTIKETIKYKD